MPSEDAKEQEKDTIGDISKQDQNPTEVKQKESMINKNKKEDPNEEQELHNASKRVKKNGLEQTIRTKKRNKEAAEGENVDGFHNGSFQEESSVESAMDEKSETRNGTEEANFKVHTLNDRDQSNDIKRCLASDTKESQSDKVVIEEEHCGGNDSDSECAEKDEESSTTKEQGSEDSNEQLSCKRTWEPMFCYWPGKEIHYFMGHKITIEESFDSYGAVIWPAAVALCKYLETPAGQEKINLLDKTVLELGAGTGLLSIVATLLGAKLTASDLPEILGNLRCNLNRNTRMVRRHEPQVIELSWGNKLEETFPHCTYHYDYVLAADVVYHHNFLAELLATMHHFCQPGTTLIWANKVRYQTDVEFAENFQKMFNVTLLEELDEIKIYSATHKSSEENPFVRG